MLVGMIFSCIYIYIYIYTHINCHPQTDCFVVSQLFSVARHVGRLKLESKPVQLLMELQIHTLWSIKLYEIGSAAPTKEVSSIWNYILNSFGHLRSAEYLIVAITLRSTLLSLRFPFMGQIDPLKIILIWREMLKPIWILINDYN